MAPWRKKQDVGSAFVDKLHTDIIRLVLQELFFDDFGALLQVSRVSRALYVASVSWIYRHVIIDFSRRSYQRLLHRLIRDGSKLPQKIRKLWVMNVNKGAVSHVQDIILLLRRLTNLQKLSWGGFIGVPRAVLDVLSCEFPKATLAIRATRLYFDEHDNSVFHESLFFSRMPAGQLTYFRYSPTEPIQWYSNFKEDFVHMLVNSPALKTLEIIDGGGHIQYFPFMPTIFRKHRLPRLRKLLLFIHSDLFTHYELELWGQQGGWSELRALGLYRASFLLSFADNALCLDELQLYPSSTVDYDIFDALLPTLNDAPFGPVDRLCYKRAILDHPVPRNHLIPWGLLSKISQTISQLEIFHIPSTVPAFTADFATPSADDIRDLRKAFPGLKNLKLDVQVTNKLWPYNILSELALFDEPSYFQLCIHQPFAKDPKDFLHMRNCRKAFEHIMSVRRVSKRSTSNISFETGFKISQAFAKLQGDRRWGDDYTIKQKRSGEIMYGGFLSSKWWLNKKNPEDFADAEDEALNKIVKKGILHGASRLGIYTLRKTREVTSKRIKHGERAEKVFGPHTTLFDEWS